VPSFEPENTAGRNKFKNKPNRVTKTNVYGSTRTKHLTFSVQSVELISMKWAGADSFVELRVLHRKYRHSKQHLHKSASAIQLETKCRISSFLKEYDLVIW
jgi:hypothetical protein